MKNEQMLIKAVENQLEIIRESKGQLTKILSNVLNEFANQRTNIDELNTALGGYIKADDACDKFRDSAILALCGFCQTNPDKIRKGLAGMEESISMLDEALGDNGLDLGHGHSEEQRKPEIGHN